MGGQDPKIMTSVGDLQTLAERVAQLEALLARKQLQNREAAAAAAAAGAASDSAPKS